ncbi:MAG: hypothetical protein E7Y34_02830, partial [Mycoplasma sp.]|nr:hypothetical protein [Mycoplasma sp.]
MNPLDPNIRSGLLYDSGLYSEIFKGKHDKKEITEEIYEKSMQDDEDGLFPVKKEEDVKGLFDFEKLVKDKNNETINKTLEEWRKELDNLNKDEKNNELTVGIENQGNGRIGEELINKINNSEFWGKHLSWYSANPLRWSWEAVKKQLIRNNIEKKEKHNDKIKYSPYVDMGL